MADGGRPLADFRPSDLDRVAVTDDIASVTVDVIAEGREREYSGLAIADATDTVTDDGEYVATEIVFDSAGLRDDEHKDLLRGLSTATVARPGEASDLSGTVVHAVTGDNVLLVVSFPGFVATDEPAGGGDDGV